MDKQLEQDFYRWVKADKNNLPTGKEMEKRHIIYKTSPDILMFLNGKWCWYDDTARGLFHVQDDSWSVISWLEKVEAGATSSSTVKELERILKLVREDDGFGWLHSDTRKEIETKLKNILKPGK